MENIGSRKMELRETKDDHDSMKNLFDLSDPEIETLKNEIKINNNLVRIFVHPYYNDKELPERKNTQEGEIKKMQSVIERILSSNSEKLPPIFIMEEEGHISRLRSLIEDIIKNKIYIIPTHEDRAEPRFKSAKPLDEEENWKKLIDELKSLKIEKIIIGGMYVDVSSLFNVEVLQRCVGETINHLSGNFKVEISNLTFPKRKENMDKQKGVRYWRGLNL